ncbi:hypothetical protein ACLBP1_29800, partial [Klebsiella pneumoniae]
MSLRKLLTLFIVLMALGTTSSWASCTRLSSPTVMLDMRAGGDGETAGSRRQRRA